MSIATSVFQGLAVKGIAIVNCKTSAMPIAASVCQGLAVKGIALVIICCIIYIFILCKNSFLYKVLYINILYI